MNSNNDTTDEPPYRRAFLGTLAGAATSLAGCRDNDDKSKTATYTITDKSRNSTITESPRPTKTPSSTPSDAATDSLDTARAELETAFAMLRKANVYDVETRLYRLDFEALGAFDPDSVFDRVRTATNALHNARDELEAEAPEQQTVNALLSLAVIARAGAELYPEIRTTYTGVWKALKARQRSDDTEALQHIKQVIKTPERWEGPAGELTDGVKSMRETGYPSGLEGFESIRWVKIARLSREAPLEFRRIGLAQKAFTKAEVSYLDGLFAFDDQKWELAIKNFEAAQRLYYRAYDNAASLRDGETYGFYKPIVNAHFCKGSKMRRGSRYLMEAAQAYLDGNNNTGKQKEKKGRSEVVEAANNCPDFPSSQ